MSKLPLNCCHLIGSDRKLVSLAHQGDAPVHSVGYQSLVGNNEHSWGWDLGRNKVYHDSKNQAGKPYPSNLPNDEPFVVPDKFLGRTLAQESPSLLGD